MQPKLVVILGPTATGKSYCGVQLAQRLDGEIISGDSMLVYKNMDIATAKPSLEERGGIKHYLIDILGANAEFNVVDFVQQARVLIADINKRGKVPILVGGTGLYIKALLEGYDFAVTQASKDLREQLARLGEEQGAAALHKKLEELDPVTAARLAVNDSRRVIRAIETALAGEQVSQSKQATCPYDVTVFGLTAPREILYPKINARVDAMVLQGIFEETRSLLAAGVRPEAQAMRSIGYRQIVAFYQGEYDKATCIEKIKQATRNFAKRQYTWYKKMPYVHWFYLTERPDYAQYVEWMHQALVEKYNLR